MANIFWFFLNIKNAISWECIWRGKYFNLLPSGYWPWI